MTDNPIGSSVTSNRRDQLRNFFTQAHGWGNAEITALPGDASFRHYYRLSNNGNNALLMDAPPETENTPAYISIARHLAALGLSSPNIIAVDEDQGFAIIEDFGHDTFTRLLNAGEDEHPLYEMAANVLIQLHSHHHVTDIKLPVYDEAKLLDEACLLPDWFLPAMTGAATTAEVRQSYVQAWRDVIRALPSYAQTVVLRDYHIDNLMVLEGRKGAAQCGILDFQDALLGHPAYDLVSLLEDARRDVSDTTVDAIRQRYFGGMDIQDSSDFESWYGVLGVQRHAKVAGIFVRLYIRDAKPVYLKHIPRVMRLLAKGLTNPALKPVKDWFDRYLPNPEKPLNVQKIT